MVKSGPLTCQNIVGIAVEPSLINAYKVDRLLKPGQFKSRFYEFLNWTLLPNQISKWML